VRISGDPRPGRSPPVAPIAAANAFGIIREH
jgi:hypothetical protein